MKIVIKISALLLSLVFFSACTKKEDSMAVDKQFNLKNKGAEMPVLVRGNATSKKILVILHGGPGSSSLRHYYQVPQFTEDMEEKYLLVYWEQRGSGVSSGNLKESEITLELMENDLDKLLFVLEEQYGKDSKIFLLGQSFGSILGNKFVTGEYAKRHHISGWITIGGLHGFSDYGKKVGDYAASYLAKQTDSRWDESRKLLDKIDRESTTLETFTDANALGKEMQNTAREVGTANKRITSDLSGGYYNPILAFTNKNKTNELIITEIRELSLEEELGKVTIPALFIYGDHDFVTPRLYGDDMMESYGADDKTLVIMEKGTHNTLATNPEESKETISYFMDRQ